mmetsp:Transcript_5159/g.9810  ORF Transcript_5159/g.9810 Transcript_5159/m.9810 type:complete len:278 (-) Transcript_5159:3314-4147(-)
MLSNLSRNSKIGIAVAVGTIVILATTLGVVLPPARVRPIAAATGTSQETTGFSGAGETSDVSDAPSISPTKAPKLVTCPCFNGDDIDKAIADILEGAPGLSFDIANICTKDEYGQSISYSVNSHMMGYAVYNLLPDDNSCRNSDMMFIITPEEAAVCSLIMDEKCTEHAAALDAVSAVAFDETVNAVECPCFTASSLEAFMADNNLPLEKGSCAASGGAIYIAYGQGMSYYRWGVESALDGTDLTCSHHDTLRLLKLQTEWDACKSIVENACADIAV